MMGEKAANGRVNPRHERGVCGEHRNSADNEGAVPWIADLRRAGVFHTRWASIESS